MGSISPDFPPYTHLSDKTSKRLAGLWGDCPQDSHPLPENARDEDIDPFHIRFQHRVKQREVGEWNDEGVVE